MKNVSKVDYSSMVTALAKDGSAIMQDLNNNSAHLMHMAIGVSGEVAEIFIPILDIKGISDVKENMTEEFGDAEFYLEGYRQGADIDPEDVMKLTPTIEPTGNAFMDCGLFSVEAGHLLDSTKRYAIYGKELNVGRVMQELRNIEYIMESIRIRFNITRQQTLDHNHNKLLAGKKARYKEGAYTNEQANNRQDKEDG